MYFYKMKRFLACIDYKTMVKVKQNALLYWCEKFWPNVFITFWNRTKYDGSVRFEIQGENC